MRIVTMGPHLNTGAEAGKTMEWVRAVQPPFLKMMDPSRELAALVKAASPSTKLVGRMYWQDQRLGNYGDFIRKAVAWAKAHPFLDYVEGYNEWGDKAQLRRFIELEVQLARSLNEAGMGACIGGFSTGFLDPEQFDDLMEAMQYIQQVGPDKALWHFHEYSGPFMQYMVQTPDGKNQWDTRGNMFTGISQDSAQYWQPGLDGWLTLRHRQLSRWLDARGLSQVRFFISESGVDDVAPRPGAKDRKGWKSYVGDPSPIARSGGGTHTWDGLPGVGDFSDQLHWYAWQLCQPASWRVLGAVTFGEADRSGDWGTFDLFSGDASGMMALVIDKQRKLRLELERKGQAMTPTVPAPAAGDRLLGILQQHLGADLVDDRARILQVAVRPFNHADSAAMKYLAVHHTVTPEDMGVQAIDSFHRDSRGFWSVGYHFIIRQGKVHWVGDVNTARAHVKDRNHEALGIAFMGRHDGVSVPSDLQLSAARRLVAALDTYYGHKKQLVGHQDMMPAGYTACPGSNLQALVKSLRVTHTTAGDELAVKLMAAAESAHQMEGLRAAPGHALWDAIVRDGYRHTINEEQVTVAGVAYIIQRAEHPVRKGDVRTYFVQHGDWGRVRYVQHPA